MSKEFRKKWPKLKKKNLGKLDQIEYEFHYDPDDTNFLRNAWKKLK